MGTIWILLSLGVLIAPVLGFELIVMRTPKGALKDLAKDLLGAMAHLFSSLLLRR